MKFIQHNRSGDFNIHYKKVVWMAEEAKASELPAAAKAEAADIDKTLTGKEGLTAKVEAFKKIEAKSTPAEDHAKALEAHREAHTKLIAKLTEVDDRLVAFAVQHELTDLTSTPQLLKIEKKIKQYIAEIKKADEKFESGMSAIAARRQEASKPVAESAAGKVPPVSAEDKANVAKAAREAFVSGDLEIIKIGDIPQNIEKAKSAIQAVQASLTEGTSKNNIENAYGDAFEKIMKIENATKKLIPDANNPDRIKYLKDVAVLKDQLTEMMHHGLGPAAHNHYWAEKWKELEKVGGKPSEPAPFIEATIEVKSEREEAAKAEKAAIDKGIKAEALLLNTDFEKAVLENKGNTGNRGEKNRDVYNTFEAIAKRAEGKNEQIRHQCLVIMLVSKLNLEEYSDAKKLFDECKTYFVAHPKEKTPGFDNYAKSIEEGLAKAAKPADAPKPDADANAKKMKEDAVRKDAEAKATASAEEKARLAEDTKQKAIKDAETAKLASAEKLQKAVDEYRGAIKVALVKKVTDYAALDPAKRLECHRTPAAIAAFGEAINKRFATMYSNTPEQSDINEATSYQKNKEKSPLPEQKALTVFKAVQFSMQKEFAAAAKAELAGKSAQKPDVVPAASEQEAVAIWESADGRKSLSALFTDLAKKLDGDSKTIALTLPTEAKDAYVKLVAETVQKVKDAGAQFGSNKGKKLDSIISKDLVGMDTKEFLSLKDKTTPTLLNLFSDRITTSLIEKAKVDKPVSAESVEKATYNQKLYLGRFKDGKVAVTTDADFQKMCTTLGIDKKDYQKFPEKEGPHAFRPKPDAAERINKRLQDVQKLIDPSTTDTIDVLKIVRERAEANRAQGKFVEIRKDFLMYELTVLKIQEKDCVITFEKPYWVATLKVKDAAPAADKQVPKPKPQAERAAKGALDTSVDEIEAKMKQLFQKTLDNIDSGKFKGKVTREGFQKWINSDVLCAALNLTNAPKLDINKPEDASAIVNRIRESQKACGMKLPVNIQGIFGLKTYENVKEWRAVFPAMLASKAEATAEAAKPTDTSEKDPVKNLEALNGKLSDVLKKYNIEKDQISSLAPSDLKDKNLDEAVKNLDEALAAIKPKRMKLLGILSPVLGAKNEAYSAGPIGDTFSLNIFASKEDMTKHINDQILNFVRTGSKENKGEEVAAAKENKEFKNARQAFAEGDITINPEGGIIAKEGNDWVDHDLKDLNFATKTKVEAKAPPVAATPEPAPQATPEPQKTKPEPAPKTAPDVAPSGLANMSGKEWKDAEKTYVNESYEKKSAFAQILNALNVSKRTGKSAELMSSALFSPVILDKKNADNTFDAIKVTYKGFDDATKSDKIEFSYGKQTFTDLKSFVDYIAMNADITSFSKSSNEALRAQAARLSPQKEAIKDISNTMEGRLNALFAKEGKGRNVRGTAIRELKNAFDRSRDSRTAYEVNSNHSLFGTNIFATKDGSRVILEYKGENGNDTKLFLRKIDPKTKVVTDTPVEGGIDGFIAKLKEIAEGNGKVDEVKPTPSQTPAPEATPVGGPGLREAPNPLDDRTVDDETKDEDYKKLDDEAARLNTIALKDGGPLINDLAKNKPSWEAYLVAEKKILTFTEGKKEAPYYKALLHVAQAEAKLGRLDDAKAHLEEVIVFFISHPTAEKALARKNLAIRLSSAISDYQEKNKNK